MTWFKMGDDFFRRDEIRAVGRDARDFYIAACTYSMGKLSDGFVPDYDIALIAVEADIRNTAACIERLKQSIGGMEPLFTAVAGGYMIRFVDTQPTRDEVQTKSSNRSHAGRIGGQRSGETRRQKSKQNRSNSEANTEANASENRSKIEANAEAKLKQNMNPVSRVRKESESISDSYTVYVSPSDSRTSQTANGSQPDFATSPASIKAEALTKIILLTGDERSKKRFGQLFDIADLQGHLRLWDMAHTATRDAIKKADPPIDAPGAYFQAVLVRLLNEHGIGVPVGTPEERSEIRRQAEESLHARDGP